MRITTMFGKKGEGAGTKQNDWP